MAAERPGGRGGIRRWQELALAVADYFTPAGLAERPEELRRARLIIGFAILGDLFGLAFAAFYGAIGHFWGAGIILVSCAAFGSVPFILKKTGSADRAGNFYAVVLIGGFVSLTMVEGGMHGHALAWLASLPLCALLLSPRPAAYWWGGLSIGAALLIVGATLRGRTIPALYPAEWGDAIAAAGYVSLVAFMFILGIIFETGRAKAHRRMEQTLGELAEANRHLTRLNEEKNEFLSIAAHDLKNPLSVVLAYSELLGAMGQPESKHLRFASAIAKEAGRMRDLIGNLLDLNAIESGRMNLKVQETNLSEVVRRSVETMQTVGRKKGIEIEASLGGEVAGLADPNALMQVLDNLISNALKFSQPNSTVRVELRAEGGFATIEVIDRGPGMSAADQGKLFQRFSKLSARPTAGESSNGLGLSIVKRLVEAMSGGIGCRSQLGEGTTFTVQLPATSSPGGIGERAASAGLERAGSALPA